MHALRKFAHGLKCGRTSCNELTGLPLAAFYQHICSTLAVPSLPFTLCFYTPLTRYDLDDTQQLRTAMHYTNVYAVTKASVALRAFV